MENATKALLIVAAVLIAVVLVAAGVLLIKNISGISKQADEVQNSLSLSTDSAIRDYQKNYVTKEEFNKFVEYFQKENRTSNGFKDIIKNEQNVKLRNQIQIIGYLYTGDVNFHDIPTNILKNSNNFQNLDDYHKYMIEEGFDILKKRNELELLPGGLTSHKQYYIKIYAKKSGYADYDTLDEETKKKIEKDYIDDRNNKTVTAWGTWSWSYDEDGYINKTYYIAHLKFEKSWYSKKEN